MITRVDADLSPLQPGQSRELRVWGDEPHRVAIRCFTGTPPPPSYRPCASCGQLLVRDGEPFQVVADRRAFDRGGKLVVDIEDAAGSTQRLEFEVVLEAAAGA